MGKTSRWFKSLLINKKEKEKGETQIIDLPTENRSATVPVPATKEKKRWSFGRSVRGAKDLNSPEVSVTAPSHGLLGSEIDQKRHSKAVAVATAAAADASVAAAQAAASIVRLTAVENCRKTSTIEESAAIKIQSLFRSYLARKALCALKGLVKLQALVRGHLVRKQATATLRCMQAMINIQAKAHTQKVQNIESHAITKQLQSYRRPSHHHQLRQSFEIDRNDEEYFKIVEKDLGEARCNSKSRTSYSIAGTEKIDHRFSTDINAARPPSKADPPVQFSPTPSALTAMSPEAFSGHFEEFSFATLQSNPHLSAISMPTHNSFDYPLYPNYMANTESSRAKARSQSEPKQRINTYERQSNRRRPLVEGRNISKGMRMQRSSSHVGLTANSHKYPWSIKLDKSNRSLKDSECGSTSTRLTNTNYCKSLVGYEIHGNNY